MTKMALMVAMNCISAYIIIPLPFSLSPIALQTLIVNLTASCLDLLAGTLSASSLQQFFWQQLAAKNTILNVMPCWAALWAFL